MFALGDVSGPESGYSPDMYANGWPATAQVALQQADYVAWNLWSAMNDRPLLPFRWAGAGEGGQGMQACLSWQLQPLGHLTAPC